MEVDTYGGAGSKLKGISADQDGDGDCTGTGRAAGGDQSSKRRSSFLVASTPRRSSTVSHTAAPDALAAAGAGGEGATSRRGSTVVHTAGSSAEGSRGSPLKRGTAVAHPSGDLGGAASGARRPSVTVQVPEGGRRPSTSPARGRREEEGPLGESAPPLPIRQREKEGAGGSGEDSCASREREEGEGAEGEEGGRRGSCASVYERRGTLETCERYFGGQEGKGWPEGLRWIFGHYRRIRAENQLMNGHVVSMTKALEAVGSRLRQLEELPRYRHPHSVQ
eukprot:Cvel_36237.t1-p1 / transcript=Cvel_36237.t1 / gene=Cvel_36237 / organism=Chromera_velia_CCMP2878 / gene_product=hypothetical protein / transcript_product=hypothetical protein / location=Cvel_scaffold7059:1-1611(-) / protein_length=278 / sequence_SO=supercontig / SO=protein_coding / is_pseudo=false